MKQVIKAGIFVVTLSATIFLTGCSVADMRTIAGGGEAISTSSVKHVAINPNHVKIYYSNINIPKHYQVLGHVSANNDNPIGIPHSQQTISDELKKQAASIGANGVINISNGMEQTGGDAILIK